MDYMAKKESWPSLTFIFITINLAVFLFSYNIHTNKVSPWLIENFGLESDLIWLKPYTLITHVFIHGDVLHFINNILMLAILGTVVEEKIGKLKLFFVYLLSSQFTVLFAVVLQYILGSFGILIGSSGAIYGLMFLAALIAGWEEVPLILIPLLNILALPAIFLSAKNLKAPLFIAILFYLLLNLVLFMLNFPRSVVEFAHFGGFLGGIVGFFLVIPKK